MVQYFRSAVAFGPDTAAAPRFFAIAEKSADVATTDRLHDRPVAVTVASLRTCVDILRRRDKGYRTFPSRTR